MRIYVCLIKENIETYQFTAESKKISKILICAVQNTLPESFEG